MEIIYKMVGSITSSRPGNIAAVYGNAVNRFPNSDYHPKQTNNNAHGFEKIQENIAKLDRALVRLNNVISPYRRKSVTAKILEDLSYLNAVQDVYELLKIIPESAVKPYQARYEVFCGEALRLNSRDATKRGSLDSELDDDFNLGDKTARRGRKKK